MIKDTDVRTVLTIFCYLGAYCRYVHVGANKESPIWEYRLRIQPGDVIRLIGAARQTRHGGVELHVSVSTLSHMQIIDARLQIELLHFVVSTATRGCYAHVPSWHVLVWIG